jgi:hypothetical protein
MGSKKLIRRYCIVVAAVAGSVFCVGSVQADGTFIQLDAGRNSLNGVLSVSQGPLTFGGLVADYDGGAVASLSVTYQVPGTGDVAVKVGPVVSLVKDDDKSDESVKGGLKVSVDRYTATDFGFLYLLGEVNSIDRSWFVLSQFGLGQSGYALEFSAGGSDAYDERSVGLSKKLGESPISLRAGYRFVEEEIFVGVSYNTF